MRTTGTASRPRLSAPEFCSTPEYNSPFHPFLILSTPMSPTFHPPHPTALSSLSLFLDFCPIPLTSSYFSFLLSAPSLEVWQ